MDLQKMQSACKTPFWGEFLRIMRGAAMCVCFLFVLASTTYAAEENASESGDSFRLADLWLWPFNNVIQPVLNGLIYPVAKPMDYAFKNGAIEKSVDLITFGERDNIFIYPSFNFKPGSRTLIGANYRHRGIFLDKDYLVVQGNYYANGDVMMAARYTKHALFGTSFFGGYRIDMAWDRDDTFILPETKTAFTQPDSTISMTWRLGRPLTQSARWNVEGWTTLKFVDASLPDVADSILVSDEYPIQDRGLYQKSLQIPVALSILYDNLDVPYAPSRGSRFGITGTYNFVGKYSGLDFDDLGEDAPLGAKGKIKDGGLNHDFLKTELLFQHYFYLGSGDNYVLSAKEARANRKFYTDFSWDEAVRVWRPENVRNTLFERRVIAFQYRYIGIWEMEEGGAPYNAFTLLNARTPLRGYGDAWSAHQLMSFSWEYRWPVDRFVDGVLFDEYALIAPGIKDWSKDRFYNSWGFGIRVRQPNMYLFRLQFGFHGLHGVNLVMTIAPEFK